MSGSIQSRLTITLTATALLLSAGVGAVLYHLIGSEMVRNFDRGLDSKGRALVSLVSLETGGLDFEFNQAMMPEYLPGDKAEYFQIRFADGKPYARSKSLAERDLPRGDMAARLDSSYDLSLPDGRRGRAIQIGFVPQGDHAPPDTAAPMVAVIAQDRRQLDENLGYLRRSILGGALVLGAATALTSIWIVRRSLAPLRDVAEQASLIDASRLDTRLTEKRLPEELVPICRRLNDLLQRLEAAFTRERRFTSDVAHELRTPIAELRSVAEVALQWPQDTESSREALADSLAIARQMQSLVDTLLSLVRADKPVALKLQSIPLAPFVQNVIDRLPQHDRPIQLSLPASICVSGEPALLDSVLTNLLGNAREYAIGQGPIRCDAGQADGQAYLAIQNDVNGLSEIDLPVMFDPFWRKDAVRTNGVHSGLGLSLVRTYCGLMGISVAALLPSPGTLCMRLVFPKPA